MDPPLDPFDHAWAFVQRRRRWVIAAGVALVLLLGFVLAASRSDDEGSPDGGLYSLAEGRPVQLDAGHGFWHAFAVPTSVKEVHYQVRSHSGSPFTACIYGASEEREFYSGSGSGRGCQTGDSAAEAAIDLAQGAYGFGIRCTGGAAPCRVTYDLWYAG